MNYKSNLECPDLTPQFKYLHKRVRAFGHVEYSDWADKEDNDPTFGIYKKCGFWTADEAAILYNVASLYSGWWLDIGTATGWTAAHLVAAGNRVVTIDPQIWHPQFWRRMVANLEKEIRIGDVIPWAGRSEDFFNMHGLPKPEFSGVVIDGNHDAPHPLMDAQASTGAKVIMLHDFIGGPVQIAVKELRSRHYKVRVYNTPNMVACCWRGDWTPPNHEPDPNVNWDEIRKRDMPNFDFGMCE